MKNKKILIEKVQTITAPLKLFDFLANKEEDYITVIEGSNGEGWDIYIGERHIGITQGELDAINFLTKAVDQHISLSYEE